MVLKKIRIWGYFSFEGKETYLLNTMMGRLFCDQKQASRTHSHSQYLTYAKRFLV